MLLLLFVVGISYNLARGRTPDCHCFGQLHSAPIGWPTLVRNLLLAAIAAFVVGFGRTNIGPDPIAWLDTLALTRRIELVVGVILVLALAIESWVLVQVLHQQGRMLLRIEALESQLGMSAESAFGSSTTGLPIDTPAPVFALPSLDGKTITLDSLLAMGKPITLIFSGPGCGPCEALLPEVGRWQRNYASKLTLAFISRGTPGANRAKIAGQDITSVLLQRDREVAEAYQAIGTPSAVLIRPDGTIGSLLAEGADEIRGLVANAIGLPVLKSLPMAASIMENGHTPAFSQPVIPKIGDPAPALTLPDLSGKPIHLADFRGNQTLLLFWDPNCSFCQQMLKDLKAWETRPPKGTPKLLVVSTGTVEANQAMSLRSPVVLDQDFATGFLFGAEGTPAAVLVDAEGKIASELAAGVPAVLALARLGKLATK
jgi:peroxiredoxin